MSCADYCAGRLRGIVENQRLLGEFEDPDFDVEIKLLRGLSYIPKGSFTAKCEHGRNFLVKRKRSRL